MRRFMTLLLAAAILCGAYAVTFGVPSAVLALIAPEDTGTAEAPAQPAAAEGGARRGGGGGGATTVVTEPLALAPFESQLNAIGTARALRSASVVADAAGTVVEVNLTANREVSAGDVLVRLDARTETLNLNIAEAELEQARDTVARYERLQSSGNSTITDVSLTEARVAQRLAEGAVGLAQVALDDRAIRAPIDGRLGLSDLDVGDTISTGDAVVSIDQTDTLLIEFEMPERVIGLLADARTVRASTSTLTGRVFEGEITSFDSRIDSVTRSVTVRARIDNPDDLLWPGMTFSVRLTQQSDPLPRLPSTAITWSREGSAVWTATGGVAQRVPVTILYRRGDAVWIDADIAAGTPVVSEGAQKLREGAAVTTPEGRITVEDTAPTSAEDPA